MSDIIMTGYNDNIMANCGQCSEQGYLGKISFMGNGF